MRTFTVTISHLMLPGNVEEHFTFPADTLKVYDDCYLFQTYDDNTSSFRTDAAFDRSENREFSITSLPLEESSK